MFRLFALTLTLFALSPTGVMAQADSAKAQAKEAFMEGRAHFAEGKFAKALDAFERANSLKRHPLMLFNMASVYESMQDLPAAIKHYQRYLASGPANAAQITVKVQALKQKLKRWPRLTLSTVPSGAQVFFSDEAQRPRGLSPITFAVPPGPQVVVLRLIGHEVVEHPINLSVGRATTMTVALPGLKPSLRVLSSPPGASVKIDNGPALGVTPLVKKLSQGPHTVHIALAGHDPVVRQVQLTHQYTAAMPFLLDAQLTKTIPKGLLSMDVSVAGAQVKIDGIPMGITPLPAPLQLTVGLHRLEIIAAGEAQYQEMVNVNEGERTHTVVELDTGGIFSSGPNSSTISYVLLGVGGAAIIGGGVTGFMAMGSNSDLSDCRADPSCERTAKEASLADDVKSQALTTDLLIGTGFVIAAGGVVMYLLSGDDAAPETTGRVEAPAFMLTPLTNGAAAVGRFEF